MNEHKCHVPGCERHVDPARLMCGMHWRLVPRALQREVWRTYRPGQEKDKNPSREYLAAATAAIEAVSNGD